MQEIIFEGIAQELLPQGGCLCEWNQRKFNTWNALPGEKIRAKVLKKNRTLGKAIAIEILTPSPERIPPIEDHFLSCSPWQIMNYETEKREKIALFSRIFQNYGIILPKNLDLYSPPQRIKYRNNMEYSIYHERDGKISLAFFARDYRRKLTLDSCILAHPSITKAATIIINWLNTVDVPYRSIKSLLLRCNSKDQVLAGLFVTEKNFPHPETPFPMRSFSIYYSNPKCPASVIDDTIYSFQPNETLQETLLQKTFHYGLMSFFQIYPSAFEDALRDMKPYVQGDILDYYSGVGAISISLADHVNSAILLDSNHESIHYAQQNIQQNHIQNYKTILAPAEKMLQHIQQEKTLIIDPPRSGLHPKVIRRILEILPQKIIYLSCNPVTCAENLQQILSHYNIIFQRLYNFFPLTPHLECLTVLQIK